MHVNFNMLAQYRSHMPDTIAYIKDYLDQFHAMKDSFFAFGVTKHTEGKVNKKRMEIQWQRGLIREGAALSQGRRIGDDNWDEGKEQRIDMINAESHFNLAKCIY